MTDISQSFTSSSELHFPRHRSQSYRERTIRMYLNFSIIEIYECYWGTADDLHRQKNKRSQRRYEQELDKSQRELQWIKQQQSESFSSPTEHIENVRAKIKNGYNQLMQVGESWYLKLYEWSFIL
jgi:hypothetical protein